MPADRGLTSLGLLMQIGGSLLLGCMLFLVVVVTSRDGVGLSHGFDLLLIGLLSAGRSALHVKAGYTLVHGPPARVTHDPFAATRTYLQVAFVHTVICALLVYSVTDTLASAATMGAFWAAWPVTLWVTLRQPAYRAMENGIPRSEDHGFEGASIYMLLFGAIGTFFAALLLYQLLRLPGDILLSTKLLVACLVCVALLYRSVLHFLAGRCGIAGELDEVVRRTKRYTHTAVISTVVCAGPLLAYSFIESYDLYYVLLVIYLLLAWPRIISLFMAQSDVDRHVTGTQRERPPDTGLTALGWLLLGLSAHGLVLAFSSAVASDSASLVALLSWADTSALATYFDHSPWLAVMISAAQSWAGISLVQMNKDHRIAPLVYGVLGTGLTLYMVWPLFVDATLLEVLAAGPFFGMDGVVLLGRAGIALALPATTLLLVRRQSLARAQASYRRPGARA